MSDLTKPAAAKRTGTSITTNPAKKPRDRTMLKSGLVKKTKVSSTIDTIMKLQEALHTRRQQRGVASAASQPGSDNKKEAIQVSALSFYTCCNFK